MQIRFSHSSLGSAVIALSRLLAHDWARQQKQITLKQLAISTALSADAYKSGTSQNQLTFTTDVIFHS